MCNQGLNYIEIIMANNEKPLLMSLQIKWTNKIWEGKKKLPNCLKLMNSFKPKNLMKYKNYPFFSLCSFSKIYKYVYLQYVILNYYELSHIIL